MKAETVAEQLMFCTVRMEGRTGSEGCTGTGFIYSVEMDDGTAHFLVTNRHVAVGMADELALNFVKRSADGTPQYGQVTKYYENTGNLDRWTLHADPDIDVAIRPLSPVLDALHKAGSPAFFRAIGSDLALIPDNYDLLDAIEDVIFVGYPSGLYDSTNLTPIVRTGTTATPVALNYEGKPLFLIDASVFGGSSGSPLLIFDRGGTHRKRDGSVHIGGRLMLLGVIAAVYQRGEVAELVETKVGVKIAHSLHLGRVYKAEAIDDCVDVLLALHGRKRASGRGAAVKVNEEAE